MKPPQRMRAAINNDLTTTTTAVETDSNPDKPLHHMSATVSKVCTTSLLWRISEVDS